MTDRQCQDKHSAADVDVVVAVDHPSIHSIPQHTQARPSISSSLSSSAFSQFTPPASSSSSSPSPSLPGLSSSPSPSIVSAGSIGFTPLDHPHPSPAASDSQYNQIKEGWSTPQVLTSHAASSFFPQGHTQPLSYSESALPDQAFVSKKRASSPLSRPRPRSHTFHRSRPASVVIPRNSNSNSNSHRVFLGELSSASSAAGTPHYTSSLADVRLQRTPDQRWRETHARFTGEDDDDDINDSDESESFKRPRNEPRMSEDLSPSMSTTSTSSTITITAAAPSTTVNHSCSSSGSTLTSTNSDTTASTTTTTTSSTSSTSANSAAGTGTETGKRLNPRRGTTLGRVPPTLRRRSTMSMIDGLDLNGDEQQDDDPDGEQQSQNGNNRPLASTGPSTQLQQPPRGRRQPLRDISTASSPSPYLPPSTLAPLMVRTPKKVNNRPRITLKDEFPVNPQYWNEYLNDGLNHLKEIEDRYDRYSYFTHQALIQPHMRHVVVSWLIELCYGPFQFETNTLHHAVSVFDRYLTASDAASINSNYLQCVGVCALMIAGKLSETGFKFSTEDLSILCDRAYTAGEIAHMEVNILVTLKFEVLVASTTSFADYFRRAIDPTPVSSMLIDLLCDLSLVSHEFLDFNTSQIAATATWISLCATGRNWTEDLAVETGYSRTTLRDSVVVFVNLVHQCLESPEELKGLAMRYQLEMLGHISNLLASTY
ncbi:hypothetical protein BG004_003010 [Podila humilis]|nr:hypothetical protein BG004_003010 [Podila humilis]